MLKQYYKTMIRTPAVIFVLLFLLSYALLPLAVPKVLAVTVMDPSASSLVKNYWYFFSIFSVAIVVIPSNFIYSQNNRKFFHNENIVMRFNGPARFWRNKLLFLLLDSAIFIIYLYMLLFLSFSLKNGIGELKNLTELLICFFLNIMGIFTFGLLFQFAFILTRNSSFGFLIAYVFVIYDFFTTLRSDVGLPSGYIRRSLALFPEQYAVNVTNLFVMITIQTIIVLLSIFAMDRMDFLTPEDNKDVS